jgi:hypothetical protein
LVWIEATMPEPMGWVLAEPWDWQRLGIGNPELCCDGLTLIAGSGSPRLLVPAGRRVRLRHAYPPVLGTAVTDGVGRRLVPLAIPGERHPGQGCKDLDLEWQADGRHGTLRQQGYLTRPQRGGSGQVDTPSDQLEAFILWAIGRFQELAHGEHSAPGGGLARTTWETAIELWQRYDPHEPTMDLIVRLAKDGALAAALAAITVQPRRVLVRIRDEVRVDRVQELDAACIRAYARRPGVTAIEKAGSRQTLLAVRRQASHDTLENRVTAWTLEELAACGQRWQARHRQARTSDKTVVVRGLVNDSRDRRNSEALDLVGTSALVHPVQPNYPLQFESRYKLVHVAYRKLLKQRQEEDDAWTWRRILWADAVRQLVATTLLQLGRESFYSHSHYRLESAQGSWLGNPCAPGPLDLGARGEWHILDARELAALGDAGLARLPEPWMSSLGVLGADLWLWCRRPQRLLPVWAILDTAERPDPQRLNRAAEALDAWQRAPTSPTKCGYTVHGLVIASRLDTDGVDIDESTVHNPQMCITGITIPLALADADTPAYVRMLRDVAAGIDAGVGP